MGRVILWVFLGLLLLLLLVLVLPSVVGVEYHKGRLRVTLRVLLLKLRLWPIRERKPRKQKEKRHRKKQPPPEEEKPEKPKPEKTLEDRIEFIKRILSSAGRAGGFMMRHIRFDDVELAAVVNMGDAAETAIWYGRLEAAIGGLVALSQEKLNIRYKRAQLVPNFAEPTEFSLYFACKIKAAPVILVAAGVLGIIQFIRYNKTTQGPAPQQPASKGAMRNGQQRASHQRHDGHHTGKNPPDGGQ